MMSRFGWQKTARVLHRRIVDDGRIAPASNLTEHLHEQEHLKGMTSLDAVENWTATARGIYYTSSGFEGRHNQLLRLFAREQSNASAPYPILQPQAEVCPFLRKAAGFCMPRRDDAQRDIMPASHFQ